jgi:hypothetical protein
VTSVEDEEEFTRPWPTERSDDSGSLTPQISESNDALSSSQDQEPSWMSSVKENVVFVIRESTFHLHVRMLAMQNERKRERERGI